MLKFLAIIAVLLTSASNAYSECVYERDAILALNYKAFDVDNSGWKLLAKNPDCSNVIADLIATYRNTHADVLLPRDNEMLSWHEGQIRAVQGDSLTAITLFQASINDTDPITSLVATANIAFLKRDKTALLKARTDLVNLPEPKGFADANKDRQARGGTAMAWPPLLGAIDSLVSCYDKPYSEAYYCTVEPTK